MIGSLELFRAVSRTYMREPLGGKLQLNGFLQSAWSIIEAGVLRHPDRFLLFIIAWLMIRQFLSGPKEAGLRLVGLGAWPCKAQ